MQPSKAAAELADELRERYTAAGFGWLADLWRRAEDKARRAADPRLAAKHRELFWFLIAELRAKAAA
jgi:hypothetical protein